MARITITDTDTHVAETDSGNVVFTFKILSHEAFTAFLSRPTNELLDEVVVAISGLEIEQGGVMVEPDQVKAVAINYPPLANWMNDEYLKFWQKKARTPIWKPAPASGQV